MFNKYKTLKKILKNIWMINKFDKNNYWVYRKILMRDNKSVLINIFQNQT